MNIESSGEIEAKGLIEEEGVERRGSHSCLTSLLVARRISIVQITMQGPDRQKMHLSQLIDVTQITQTNQNSFLYKSSYNDSVYNIRHRPDR